MAKKRLEEQRIREEEERRRVEEHRRIIKEEQRRVDEDVELQNLLRRLVKLKRRQQLIQAELESIPN